MIFVHQIEKNKLTVYQVRDVNFEYVSS